MNNSSPKKYALKDIISFLHKKHIVFYTGARVSAGVVPTMAQLVSHLNIIHLIEQEDTCSIIEHVIKNSKKYLNFMEKFYHACLYGKPTPAHEAISSLVKKQNWGLLTENLDFLHQRTGISPLSHESNWLAKNIKNEDLKLIDYVITIGLANDESSFLAWYKKINPTGIIIAINLEKPSYLSDEDILIQEDAQKFLPALLTELEQNYMK